MNIVPIHTFTDNFVWLIRDDTRRSAVVVDPGESRPVIETLRREHLELAAILITHRHGDHVGGVPRLLESYPGIAVYGPAGEPIPAISHPLGEGDHAMLDGPGLDFDVLEVPGHTEGHIAYYNDRGDGPVLFCGDTLFSVGCGRVFSGTHEQLHDSLMRIATLPGDTLIYCAHEYTLDNIGFAKWVEPDNQALHHREREAHAQLGAGRDTVPSTLAMEMTTNPFLRIRERPVIAAAERHAGRMMMDSRDTFRTIRQWKDSEYD